MRRRMFDWMTLVVTALLMAAGLMMVALSRSSQERLAGLTLVLGASTALAAPVAAVRICGLTIALTALCTGLALEAAA